LGHLLRVKTGAAGRAVKTRRNPAGKEVGVRNTL